MNTISIEIVFLVTGINDLFKYWKTNIDKAHFQFEKSLRKFSAWMLTYLSIKRFNRKYIQAFSSLTEKNYINIFFSYNHIYTYISIE